MLKSVKKWRIKNEMVTKVWKSIIKTVKTHYLPVLEKKIIEINRKQRCMCVCVWERELNYVRCSTYLKLICCFEKESLKLKTWREANLIQPKQNKL